jgi:fatty acid desaturase
MKLSPAPLRPSALLAAVEWRDLVALTPIERVWEITLSLPWLVGSLFCYAHGWWWLGLPCSFYFFLTGLRQSHNAQHYSLGFPRFTQDGLLFFLSVLMLSSMHAVQVTHLHHHRHCLGAEDTEGATARLPWWRAILIGPLFPLRLHVAAWRQAKPYKRAWIVAELVTMLAVIMIVLAGTTSLALRWHWGSMLIGECFTGFFAVWAVHHDCAPGDAGRTQRGRCLNGLSYSMFFHAEHHLFPAVPTCHLATLAERLDAITLKFAGKQVLGTQARLAEGQTPAFTQSP